MCSRAFIIRKDKPDAAIVPCGKCPECLKRRASQWAFRLGVHSVHQLTGLFVTLTYDDAFLPQCDAGPGLSKHDLQCFFKRLRKFSKHKVSYYACGEYGGVTRRPHYHAIIFNVSDDMVQSAWKLDGVSLGHTAFGPVNDATIKYVTGYICKSYGRKLSNHLPPEFSVMSKGIGLQYLNNSAFRFHREGMNNFVTDNCVKIAMPRYFAERIFSSEERKLMSEERIAKIAAGELRVISDVGIYEFIRDKNVNARASERAAMRKFDGRDFF